jgi:hypothetical protein
MMNKLIDKIVDITAAEIPGVCQLEYESGESGVEFSNPALERFVELIVKECLTVVKNNISGPAGEYDYSYTDDTRAQTIYDEIKAHFGVDDERKD